MAVRRVVVLRDCKIRIMPTSEPVNDFQVDLLRPDSTERPHQVGNTAETAARHPARQRVEHFVHDISVPAFAVCRRDFLLDLVSGFDSHVVSPFRLREPISL